MAHLVGSMMYVGKTPWHGLGKEIPEGKKLGIDEALIGAGLDWDVDLRRLYTEDGYTLLSIHERCAVCRQEDNAVLGIVGPEYTPLQNKEAFAWFQPFLDTADVTLETAGSLKGGRWVWVLAKIQRASLMVGAGDEVAHYVLLSNSHDGSLAVRVGFTPIRVVCNNTLCLAHESEASRLLRVRHTARLLKNLDEIREIIDIAHEEFCATIEQYRALMKKEINQKDLAKYVKLVFELPETGGRNLIPIIADLLDHGRGSDMAGRTCWGAYNAVTEYLNYFRGKNQDNTLSSLWYGDSSQVNKRGLEAAMKMAV